MMESVALGFDEKYLINIILADDVSKQEVIIDWNKLIKNTLWCKILLFPGIQSIYKKMMVGSIGFYGAKSCCANIKRWKLF